nr:putative late blight resistance protein homolog R1A-3 [Coffea arabica]
MCGSLCFCTLAELKVRELDAAMWASDPESFMKQFLPSHILDSLIKHVASVAIRLANLSCLYWFKEVDTDEKRRTIIGILNLQQEIDLSTAEFLEMNLKLLRAVNQIQPGQITRNKVTGFLSYLLLHEEGALGVADELKYLIELVISQPEKPCNEVETFLTEIKAVIREAASLSNSLDGVCAHSPKVEVAKIRLLEEKIWLLKAEHFLKGPRNTSFIDNPYWDWKSCITSLDKGLKNLRSFSKDLPKVRTILCKQNLSLVEEVPRELQSVLQSFSAKEITEKRMRESLLLLLLKILVLKADFYLLEILNGNANLLSLAKDRIESVREGLKLLMTFVANVPKESSDHLEFILTNIEAVAKRIIYLYHSFLTNKIAEELIERMYLTLSELLDQIKVNKAKLRELYPQVQGSCFPKTNGLGCVDFLLRNLKELQTHKSKSIATVKNQIERIQGDMEFFRSFLNDRVKERTQHQELKGLGERITEVAYKVEYVIDSIEVGIGDHLQHLLWLDSLLEDISHIKMEAVKSYQKKTCDGIPHNVTRSSAHMISQVSAPEPDEVVVSLSDQEEVIIDRLIKGSLQQDMVSLVGMPGIGKTTLAKKLYNDSRVTYHFHIRAWCCISQVYSKRQVLLDILSNISGLTDYIHKMTDEDLDLELYQQLKGRRYLIVMDDMWSTEAWDDLERSFPDDKNGSRLLITSRIQNVALNAKPNSDPYLLRLLTDDESWSLLQLKSFHGKGCPTELLGVGKEIAQQCKGLPLSVVAVAGLLERTEKKPDLWKQIVDSLSRRLIDDPQTQCKEILELSYEQLPYNLKACFLYFGAFLEDKDISVRKLIRLWVSEGFIKKSEEKSLEDLGEDYLMDLVGRSLVLVSKRRSIGGVKTCRVHDMLHDLCLSRSKEEMFLQPITKRDEPFASFDGLDDDVDFDHYYPSKPLIYERHRLCICLERRHFIKSKPSGPRTRSLLFSAIADRYPRCPYDITFIFQNFKLLRVLDLESINMGMFFPIGFDLLVQLRYLAVSGDLDSIPPSIASLWKLETFVVKGLKGMVVLPVIIWSMRMLTHVHVTSCAMFDLQDDQLESSLVLDNLVTLSTPALSGGKETLKILRRFPNLHRLRCIVFESPSSPMGCDQFPQFDILNQLESLNISGRALNQGELSFPLNLKKLTLSRLRLPWKRMSAIGRLQSLEVLKLLSNAFEGRIWDMREGEFLKLKFLKLDSLNVVEWNATCDHLPNLQQLFLRHCKELEAVPFSFGEIPTLLMIQVQRCGLSTEESVRDIEEQGIEGLKIFISH